MPNMNIFIPDSLYIDFKIVLLKKKRPVKATILDFIHEYTYGKPRSEGPYADRRREQPQKHNK
jgi:hypothetical protein